MDIGCRRLHSNALTSKRERERGAEIATAVALDERNRRSPEKSIGDTTVYMAVGDLSCFFGDFRK